MIYLSNIDKVEATENGQIARVDLATDTTPATLPTNSEGIEDCPTLVGFKIMSTLFVTSTGAVYIHNGLSWDEQ